MLTIRTPTNRLIERLYSFEVLLTDILGVSYEVDSNPSYKNITITDGSKKLSINDSFFTCLDKDWLQISAMPQPTHKIWHIPFPDLQLKLSEITLPNLYGDQKTTDIIHQKNDGEIYLALDIFGSTFFMLTNYEEYVSDNHDEHGRFLASNSYAYKNNFLQRPVVNEYLEVLWYCMKRLWPQLTRKKLTFSVRPTHDIDIPFLYVFENTKKLIREMGKSLIRKKSIKHFLSQPAKFLLTKKGYTQHDPYNTYDRLLKISELIGTTATFYFKSNQTSKQYDYQYDISHPVFKPILQNIAHKGHKNRPTWKLLRNR